MEDETGNVLASEINDVLRCTFKFQHFMVSSGFKTTGFKLISNLDLLVVFPFVVEVVLKFDDEFNGFAQSVHDEFLGSERFDLGDLQALFLFCKFGEHVLLLALELDFLNAGLLFLFGCEDLGKETFLAVRLRTCRDDLNDTLGDFFLQPVVFHEHGLVDFLQIANLQTGVSELVGRGVVDTTTEQCKIGVLLCHPSPSDKLRRADTPKKSLSPACSIEPPDLKVHASSSHDAKSTPKSAHSSNSKVSGRR